MSFVVVGCGTSNSNPPEQSKEPEYPIAGRWQADLTSAYEDVDWEELDIDWEELGMDREELSGKLPKDVNLTIGVIDSSTLIMTNSEDEQSMEVPVLYDNEEHTTGSFRDPTTNEKLTFSILGNDTLRLSDLEFIRIE